MRIRDWIVGVVVTMVLVVATPAAAQGTTDEAPRRELLDRAMRAAESGNEALALELATRAGELQMTTSVRAFIALRQNALGRYQEAMSNAIVCVREATYNAIPQREAVLHSCEDLVRQLQPRVARITVVVPDTAPRTTTVRINGRPLHRAFWGQPYIVTPGTVTVEVAVGDRAILTRSLAIGAGAQAEVPVVIPSALAIAAGSDGAARRGPSLVGPGIVIGLGAAVLASSLLFFGLRVNTTSQLDAYCNPVDASGWRHCDPLAEAQGLYQAGVTYTSLTLGTAIAGSAGVAVGGIWAIAASVSARRAAPPERARLQIAPSRDGLFFTIGGVL
jgi:hypothetical protein